MANAQKLSYAELKTALASYVAAAKIVADFSPSYNLSGLLDKIGKIFTHDQIFTDKLAEFDAEFLEYGTTIEEYAQDLILPDDVATADDEEVIRSHYGTFRPTAYSFSFGDKVFPLTYKKKDISKAVHNETELVDFIMSIQRTLTNSVISYRYGAKRQLLGRLVNAVLGAMNDTGATLWVKGTSQSVIGTRFKNASTGTKWAVLVKPYVSTADKTFDEAVAAGYLVQYNLISTIAKPTSTETGESFIKEVKKAIEVGSDISEGNSLSGNTLGANNGMTLFVKQGIIPSLEVDTYAGAFNKGDLTTPAKIIVLPDFGDISDNDVYAVLIDSRAIRLFPTNNDAGEEINDYKGFVNFFRHFDATGTYSKNVFVKVFKDISAEV